MTDRETLEAVAKGCNELTVLRMQQLATIGKVLRACVAQLKSPDSRKRKEVISALETLAEMMEKPR